MSSWDKETPGSWYSQFSTGSKVSKPLWCVVSNLLFLVEDPLFLFTPYFPSSSLFALKTLHLSLPPPSSPTWTLTASPWAWFSWASCVSWASRPVKTSPTTATAQWPGPTEAPTTMRGRCTSRVPTMRSWATRPTLTSKPWSTAALWVNTHELKTPCY